MQFCISSIHFMKASLFTVANLGIRNCFPEFVEKFPSDRFCCSAKTLEILCVKNYLLLKNDRYKNCLPKYYNQAAVLVTEATPKTTHIRKGLD